MDRFHDCKIIPVLFIISVAFIIYSVANDESACTYYIDARFSQPENGLPNCSWYSKNACCKRTEVTAVLGGMYKVHQATNSCRYHLNYMMCYFCSPEQINWYDTRLYICSDFCDATYEECKTAYYNGMLIGDAYTTGKTFCEANSFDVVPGRERCFYYDPTVFGRAPPTAHSVSLLTLCVFAFATVFILK